MKTKTKVNNSKEIEMAVAILKLSAEEVYIDHKNKRLEAIVSSSVKLESQGKIKRALDKMAQIFDCRYHSRYAFSWSGGYEDGFYYHAYEDRIHEFEPKRITKYKIYVKEHCSTSLA